MQEDKLENRVSELEKNYDSLKTDRLGYLHEMYGEYKRNRRKAIVGTAFTAGSLILPMNFVGHLIIGGLLGLYSYKKYEKMKKYEDALNNK